MLLSTLVSCKRFKSSDSQKAFVNEFNRHLSLPLTADSLFIAQLDTLEAMDLPLLETLQTDTVKEELAGTLNASIGECLFIEKLKQSGRYQGYLDSLSPGMIKNAMAFKVGKIELKDGTHLLLWGINESSFDADPFFSGTSIIASYTNNKGGLTHVVIDESYNAGDPPSFLQKRTTAQLTENEMRITTKTQARDADEEEWKKETAFLKLQLESGELKVLQKASSKN